MAPICFNDFLSQIFSAYFSIKQTLHIIIKFRKWQMLLLNFNFYFCFWKVHRNQHPMVIKTIKQNDFRCTQNLFHSWLNLQQMIFDLTIQTSCLFCYAIFSKVKSIRTTGRHINHMIENKTIKAFISCARQSTCESFSMQADSSMLLLKDGTHHKPRQQLYIQRMPPTEGTHRSLHSNQTAGKHTCHPAERQTNKQNKMFFSGKYHFCFSNLTFNRKVCAGFIVLCLLCAVHLITERWFFLVRYRERRKIDGTRL